MFSIKLTPKYPTYPPYHKGEYLEDYFISYQEKTPIKTNRKFIPVSWTTYYCDYYPRADLQKQLDELDQNYSYYLLCQHDDAPQETLPADTLIFSAGGNCEKPGVIPIPLICSSLPQTEEMEKETLVSFVGSVTHQLRYDSLLALNGKEDVRLMAKGWSNNVSDDQFQTFIDETRKSYFCLAPRGYGKSSFRMYEAMQLDSIPVYVSDSHYLPFSDVLNWEEFCVIIYPNQIPDLYDILKSYSQDQINSMRDKIKEVYPKYFTLDAMCENVKRILENE